MEVVSRKEALEKGLKRYFTGKSCKHGHASERSINGKCLACVKIERQLYPKTKEQQKEYSSRYYKKNSNEIKEKVRRWAKDNPEKRKEISINWAKDNPDRTKYIQKKFIENNPERSREIKHKWAENNKEQQRECRRSWRQSNKWAVCALTMRRNAQKLHATPSWLTKENLDSIKLIYKDAAERAQRDGISYHVDHIVPLQGETVSGLHVPWNLQILEASENISKSNRFADI